MELFMFVFDGQARTLFGAKEMILQQRSFSNWIKIVLRIMYFAGVRKRAHEPRKEESKTELEGSVDSLFDSWSKIRTFIYKIKK